MTIIKKLTIICAIGLASCSTTSKSYFTTDTRNKVEQKSIAVDQLQYYIDKDVELRRELSSGDVKVSSGKVISENGKYINIILLKAGTPGACTQIHNNSLDIAFESGDNKNITFSVNENAGSNGVYKLSAEKWISNYNSPEIGKITYDGQVYFMRFDGARPKLMIKKSSNDKYEVNKRVMSGRKIS
ncbi:MAG: hypothetical protein QM737_21100 [Ferruginibacter sp.]